jgi:hypothetical protein
VAKRREPMPAQTLVLIAAACLIVLLLAGGGAFLIFYPSQSPASNVRPAAQVPPAGSTASPVTTTAHSALPANREATPPVATAAVPAPTASPAKEPAVITPPATVSVALPTARVAATTSTASPSHAVTAPKSNRTQAMPDPRITSMVEGFKITGIRASSTDPKVLMNDRVFRINDIIDHTSGLKLTAVAPDRLTFVDSEGAVYTKDF